MISYKVEGTLAVIQIDDGKANALGTVALDSLQSTLDDAERDGVSAIILKGRPGVFSSGFDLEEVRSDPTRREAIRLKFVDLLIRLFDYERPVIVACTGHALAAGAALLLVADRRIGIGGRFKLGFNEAAIGVPISGVTVELARYRMPMPWFESLISARRSIRTRRSSPGSSTAWLRTRKSSPAGRNSWPNNWPRWTLLFSVT